MKWVVRLLDRLFAVAGAFLLSQFPQFLQQYSQRLAGHLAEINRHVSLIQENVALSGRSLQEYIHKFLSFSDGDVSRQGSLMEQVIERQHQLSDAYIALQQATPFTRPFAFLAHFQTEVVKGTMVDFQPGFSFSAESCIYALIGMLIGYCFWSAIVRLGRFVLSFAVPTRSAPSPLLRR